MELQGLDNFLLPFLLLAGTGHVYSSSSIVLCLNSTCSIFQSLLYCSIVLLYHLVPSLYSLPPGLWVTKALNYMSSELIPSTLKSPVLHSPCPATAVLIHLTSWPADKGICYFMLVARYLCLMAFSKLCFCHKNSTCALSHQSLEQREFLFPLHMAPHGSTKFALQFCLDLS